MKRKSWLRRTTPLKRGDSRLKRSELKRGKGPGRASKAKRDAEWERAYGSEERVRWIQRLPCLVCGERPSENAHTESGGMGRKADADTVVPLCESCHRELHQRGQETCESEWGLDLSEEAGRIEKLWRMN